MLLTVLRRLSPSIRRFLKWTGLAGCATLWITLYLAVSPRNYYLIPIFITLAISTAALFWNDQQYGMFAVLAGVLAHSCVLTVMVLDIAFGWRRPVEDWMMAHGLGAYAGHYAVFHLFIPDIILNLVGGAFVGFCCYRRWLQYALTFGVTPFVLGYIPFIMSGSPFSMAILYHLMIIPFAICGAWLAPGRRRRYEAWRAAEGFCKSCGYNLFSNTSGICPECGTPIPKEVKVEQVERESEQWVHL